MVILKIPICLKNANWSGGLQKQCDRNIVIQCLIILWDVFFTQIRFSFGNIVRVIFYLRHQRWQWWANKNKFRGILTRITSCLILERLLLKQQYKLCNNFTTDFIHFLPYEWTMSGEYHTLKIYKVPKIFLI